MENMTGAAMAIVLGTGFGFLGVVFVLLRNRITEGEEREKWEVFSYDEVGQQESE
jgi:Na+-driven multidrug efflux pump